MATTVEDIVSEALRDLGVLASGEVCPGADGQDALKALNRRIDQWAAERLLIYADVRYTGTLLPVGTVTYAISPTGKFAVPGATVFVSAAGYYDSTDTTQTEIFLTEFTEEGWAKEAQKILTSTVPSYYRLERSTAS